MPRYSSYVDMCENIHKRENSETRVPMKLA